MTSDRNPLSLSRVLFTFEEVLFSYCLNGAQDLIVYFTANEPALCQNTFELDKNFQDRKLDLVLSGFITGILLTPVICFQINEGGVIFHAESGMY